MAFKTSARGAYTGLKGGSSRLNTNGTAGYPSPYSSDRTGNKALRKGKTYFAQLGTVKVWK